MERIESPPEVTEVASDLAMRHGYAMMVAHENGHVSPDGMDEAIGEMRELFPHLDDATLVLFCHYLYIVAEARRGNHDEQCCGGTDMWSMAVAYSDMASRIGRPLL